MKKEKPPDMMVVTHRVFLQVPAPSLLQVLPVPVYITDAQGRIVFFNEAAEVFAGRTPALGELWCVTWRLFWPDGKPMAHDQSPMALALNESRPVRNAEVVAERPDGTRIPFMPYPTPLFDEQGELVGAINVLVDLTSQKRSEVVLATPRLLREATAMLAGDVVRDSPTGTLERSERDFQLLIRSVTDYAIFMLDKNGCISSWNSGAERIKGYREEEVLGRHFSCFYTPEDQVAGVPQLALATAASEGRYEAESWRVRKDGTRFWANVVIDPIWDQNVLVGYAKVTRDITSRRASDLALVESERRARGILDTALDAFVQVDDAGCVTEWNPQAHALFGWPRDTALGQTLASLCFATDDDDTAEWMKLAVNGGMRHPSHQVLARNRAGHSFPVEVSVSTLSLESGRLTNIFIRDLTEKMQMESQLRQGQKMEAMGQLTGGIAHDFNNILQAISGSLEVVSMLNERGQQERSQKHIGNALDSVKRAAALTHRLLAFARRQSLDPQLIDVGILLRGMTDMLRHQLGERTTLEVVLPDGLWSAHCDPNQLENAILNLIINARDAMPGGGWLRIEASNVTSRDPESTDHETPDQPYIKITITDNGAGMSREVRERAFDPFYTTKPTGAGTGLGLSMVYGFVRQSRGYCTIDSVLGEGTSVQLYLPRHIGEQEQTVAQKPAASPRVAQGEHILLVEDEEVIRSVITEVLSNLGYVITEAADGLEGVSLAISDCPIDLIITDIGLPGINGRSLAQTARERHPDLPILLITGYDASAASDPLVLQAGTAILSKPFTVEKLREQVNRLLDWRRARSPQAVMP